MTTRDRISLGADIAAFLRFKRALGYPYARAEFTLRAFDRFVAARCRRNRSAPLADLLRAWLGREGRRAPASIGNDASVLRQFCLHRQRRDPTAYVPMRGWAPTAKAPPFVPHVLSVADVTRLVRLAGALARPAFRGVLYRTLLLVLYGTGLRFGEALRLRLRDVDLTRDVLFVAAGKGRARWVPFHRSLHHPLRRYLSARRAYAVCGPDARLFVGHNGVRLGTSAASDTVRALLRAAGLKPPAGRVGPRPYDLRHTFAVHRLTRWYHAGVDLHARLPWLSAYMGHDDLLGTETYLTATPALLHVAARRLAHRLAAPRRWP